jgi:hypothetical protein
VLRPAPLPAAPAPEPATIAQLQHFHWSTIAAGPDALGTVSEDASVWDGHEVLAWEPGAAGGAKSRFAAYDPASNRWRSLPAPPLPAGWDYSGSVWSGSEFILLGQPSGGAPSAFVGVAYDAATDAWHRIPSVQLCYEATRQVVWDGSRVLVLPGAASRLAPSCQYGSGAAYDPVANTWSTVPTIPVSAKGSASSKAVGGNGRAIVLIREGGANSLEPPARYEAFLLRSGASSWERLTTVPDPLDADIDSVTTTGPYLVIPPTGGCAAGGDCAPGSQQFHDGYLIDASTGTVRRIHADESRPLNLGIAFTSIVDTGGATFNIAYGDGGDTGTPVYAYAWDARGADISLPSPRDCKCGNQQVPSGPGIWTGHELLFFDGATSGWRFGP